MFRLKSAFSIENARLQFSLQLQNETKTKMSRDVVIMSGGAPDASLLTGTRSTARSRSMRKRKFTTEELAAPVTKAPLESDFEGPFWFEKSTTRYVNGEKTHFGITRRERQLLNEIVKSGFFTTERLRDVVVPLNDETSKTPRLRAFDWAVTNFSKGRPALHIVDGTIVDPNLDYQNELRKHHRLLFDPFRRGTHLFFELPTTVGPVGGPVGPSEAPTVEAEAAGGPVGAAGPAATHRTTVGQLCFIKWCIEHHVDRYVEANIDAIRAHMSATTRRTSGVKRRRELTTAPTRVMRGAVFDTMTIQ